MKKALTIILLLIFQIIIYGQNEKIIIANNLNNIFLHFPNTIKTGMIGNENFIFISGENSKIGIIKANGRVKATNLLVTTSDDLIYSFVIKHKESINKYNYFIASKDAINYTEKKEIVNIVRDTIQATVSMGKEKLDINEIFKNEYCKNLLKEKPFYLREVTVKNGLVLELLNITYKDKKLYFSFELKNKNLIDFTIDYINFNIVTKSRKKRTTSQAIEKKPLNTYKIPKILKGKKTSRFIAIFDEFNISKSKAFLINIKDKNGERDIAIPIHHKQINNPN